MAKRPSRNDIEQAAGASIADIFGTPRKDMLDAPPSPRRRRTRNAGDGQALAERYGKTPPWRLPPNLIEAVRVAADENQVRPKDLVEYVLRVSLVGLASGKLQLPLDEETTTHQVAPGPDIPEDFALP
jgi:hypothetical protein